MIRLGVEAMVKAERQEALAQAYVRGYGQLPESEEELAKEARLAMSAIHGEPWEKWW
ncbi:MAG: hypothetical protein ACRDRT_00105 [Pseudonocardiaceae bacterium]